MARSGKLGLGIASRANDLNSPSLVFCYTQGVGESCLAIFLPALVMGNFMVLNLFLALLLNSFNSEELKSRKEVSADWPIVASTRLLDRDVCCVCYISSAISISNAVIYVRTCC